MSRIIQIPAVLLLEDGTVYHGKAFGEMDHRKLFKPDDRLPGSIY